MGNYILCHERRAKRPYYIEAAGVNIWTIEELCYFLCEYVWLVDRSLLSEKLCDWVDKELQMPRLAKLLYAQCYRGGSLKEFSQVILENTGYCSKNEIYRIARLLDGMEHVSEPERLKQKGDYLLKDHKYRRAIGMYNQVLAMRRRGTLDGHFYSEVWRGKGNAYARLFLFREAAKCMDMACEQWASREARSSRLAALYLSYTEEEFQEQCRQRGIPQEEREEFLQKARDVYPRSRHLDASRLRREYGRDNV